MCSIALPRSLALTRHTCACCRESRPLLRSLKDHRVGLDYNDMADWTKDVFELLVIIIRKVTHAMRVGGSQYLESQG